MSNADRFLNAYASMEKSMNRMVGRTDYIPFATLIHMTAKNHPAIRRHEEDLKEICELRNAIVHQRGSSDEIIAEPCDSITASAEHLAALMEEDQKILHYASQPVRYAGMDDTVRECAERMKRADAGKLPVYEKGKVSGLITVFELLDAAMAGKGDWQIRELVHENSRNRIIFLSTSDTIEDAVREFSRFPAEERRLPVILITEHGRPDEKPLGILSSADLARILSSLI
ncbi:MAG: CBS domain-containing protein [Lachnospiraceae bacterium]|nr:CBS domain-containing protein [Erysipelotrichaceae bacterium]MDY4682186.1 CBS domain-containing protein [Lachnospiraceae bacterium]